MYNEVFCQSDYVYASIVGVRVEKGLLSNRT